MTPAMTEMLMVNCNTPMLLAHGFIPAASGTGQRRHHLHQFDRGPYRRALFHGLFRHQGIREQTRRRPGRELHARRHRTAPTICPGATDTEAPRRQGIDRATLRNVMSLDEVATLALENMSNGPVHFEREHYKAMFEQLLAMPRRDALTAMARNM